MNDIIREALITEEQYIAAKARQAEDQDILNAYANQRTQAFEKKMKENPSFNDNELLYAATRFCPCGHGLAYPKGCGAFHYWDCSAVLKGVSDTTITHCGRYPFTSYKIRGESENNGTTRGVTRPKPGI